MSFFKHCISGGAFLFFFFFKHSHSPLDADTLVFVTLRCDHDIRLIQHEHPNLLGIDEPQLAAPVQHGAGRANDDLFLKLHTALHWKVLRETCQHKTRWIPLEE